VREPRGRLWRAGGLDGVRRCGRLDVSGVEGLHPLHNAMGLNRMAGCSEDRLLPSSPARRPLHPPVRRSLPQSPFFHRRRQT
jgi:hypothetical protein